MPPVQVENEPTEPQNTRSEHQAESESTGTEPLALPAPTDADDAQKLDLNQQQIAALKFDALGPMVVNSDGTLSRITNWDKMIPLERERTMRVLNARNRLRLDEQQKKVISDSSAETSTVLQQAVGYDSIFGYALSK